MEERKVYPYSIRPDYKINSSDIFNLHDRKNNFIKKGSLSDLTHFNGNPGDILFNDSSTVFYKWNSLYKVWMQFFKES